VSARTLQETDFRPVTLLLQEEGSAMKRILQPNLMRGPVAQRAAIVLLLGLIAVLCVSVVQGVQGLN
jgi:hypothetical protein